MGVCCFKWDARRATYSSRPFNVYVWPHSEILGDSTMQFKTSNIRFLMKHNFDFNKLFNLGVNYQRLSDQQAVRDKIAQKTQDPTAVISIASNEGARYNERRSYQSIGSASQQLLKQYIRAVANFAELVQSSEDIYLLEIPIESFALRRRLSQELQSFYKDSNLIFTQFSKANPIFTVRKWRPKPEEGQGLPQLPETKVTLEQLQDSPFDKIIKGQLQVQAVFEDERVIVFPSKRPCARVHLIVLAKSSQH